MDSGNVWCLPWQQMCRSLLPVCDGFGDNLLCRFLIPTYLLSSYHKEKEKRVKWKGNRGILYLNTWNFSMSLRHTFPWRTLGDQTKDVGLSGFCRGRARTPFQERTGPSGKLNLTQGHDSTSKQFATSTY